MNQLCLSRQYFPLQDFSVDRGSPEAEARIIQTGLGSSTKKCSLFFGTLAELTMEAQRRHTGDRRSLLKQWSRRLNCETLGIIDTDSLQLLQHGAVFDKLGDSAHAGDFANLLDGLDDSIVYGIFYHGPDESPIYLKEIGRDRFQISE
jgi:hypothetical protein